MAVLSRDMLVQELESLYQRRIQAAKDVQQLTGAINALTELLQKLGEGGPNASDGNQ